MSSPTTHARRAFAANIWKCYAYGFLTELSLSAPIWVLYLREARGLSLAQITFLEVPLFLLIVLGEVPTGAVADRFGRKISLTIGAAMLAVGMLVYGSATHYAVILLANITWGVAFTFRSGADTALLYDSLVQAGREHDFARISGRYWALRSTAMLTGFLLGAPIAAAGGYTFAITLAAVIHACAVPVALAMHEPTPIAARGSEPYLRTLTSGVREAWRQPRLRCIFLASGILTASSVAPLLLFQQPWLAAHGIEVADVGLWQAPVQAAEIVAALAAGWVLARLGERAALFAMPVVLSLCGTALAAVDHSWIAIAFVGIALVRGVQNPVVANYVNRHIDSRRRATVLSVQSLTTNLIMAGAWPLGGFVADAFGLRAAFFLFACTSFVLGGGLLLLWHRAERRDPLPPELECRASEVLPRS